MQSWLWREMWTGGLPVDNTVIWQQVTDREGEGEGGRRGIAFSYVEEANLKIYFSSTHLTSPPLPCTSHPSPPCPKASYPMNTQHAYCKLHYSLVPDVQRCWLTFKSKSDLPVTCWFVFILLSFVMIVHYSGKASSSSSSSSSSVTEHSEGGSSQNKNIKSSISKARNTATGSVLAGQTRRPGRWNVQV